jgi:thymidine kinase
VAKLNFYYGAMTCGKSERLISTARNYTIRELPIVTMMPAFSMREPGFTTSRGGERWPIDIATDSDTAVYEAYHEFIESRIGLKAVEAVLVDEAQFMTESQIDDLEKIAKLDGTSVVAFGLRSNIRRKLFEGSQRLFELADRSEKIITMCKCGKQAEYNGRFANGVFHIGEPIVWIDNSAGADYDAMCADCYLGHMNDEGAVLE